MEKKLIERNLKFSDKYHYVDITRGSIESGQLCSCDNCGKLITNMVHIIRDSDKAKFIIGTDCAETLTKCSQVFNTANSEYYLDIYSLNSVNRFITQAKKYPDNIKYESIYFIVNYIDNKGKSKQVQAFEHTLKKFYPEFLNSLTITY